MISEAGTSRLQYGSRRQNPAPAPALYRPAAGTTAAVTAQPEPARCIASLHFRRLSAAGCAAGGRNCRSRPAGGPLLQCYLGTFKIHIAKSGLFVITPFTQAGANFLKTPILFPHNYKTIFVSLNPITNNVPLHKFIIKNIPSHLNTSHFSHMPHLFKCHPLAQPNTTNSNKKTWSLIIHSVNPPTQFYTQSNFPYPPIFHWT